MSAGQLATRIVGSIGRINQGHLKTGKLTDEEWPRLVESMEQLRGATLYINESSNQTPTNVRSSARRLAVMFQ